MAQRLTVEERVERERLEAGADLLSNGLEARMHRSWAISSLVAGFIILGLAVAVYALLSPLSPLFALAVAAFGAIVVLGSLGILLRSTPRWKRRIRAAGFNRG